MKATITHICGACGEAFVHPDFGFEEGSRWRVFLRCQSCGWLSEQLLDDAALERFEREIDRERALMEKELRRLTRVNMREYLELFTAALAVDAILPEDF